MAEFNLCDILNPEEKHLLRYDPENMWIAAKIKTMGNEELWKYHSIEPKARDMAHYHFIEEEWKKTSEWLLGINLGRHPSKEEAEEDYARRNGHRFKPFYALKYQNNIMEIQEEISYNLKSHVESQGFWTEMF